MLAYKKEIELDLSDSYTSEVACFLSRTSRHETPAQPTKRAELFSCREVFFAKKWMPPSWLGAPSSRNSTSTAIARTVVQWFLYCLRFPLAVVEMQQGPPYVPMQNAA